MRLESVLKADVPRMRAPPPLVTAILAALVLFHVFAIYMAVISRSPYHYGDWTINYAAGFIRRGLGGETVLWLSELTGLPPYQAAFALISAITLAFFAGLYALAAGNLLVMEGVLLLSPAGLGFAVYQVEPARKDIIALALLAGCGVLLMLAKRNVGRLSIAAAGFAALVGISALVHETVVFLSPIYAALFFFAFAAAGARMRAWLAAGAIMAVPAAVFLVTSATLNMPPDAIAQICARFGDSAPFACQEPHGAVGWLQQSSGFGISTVVDAIRDHGYLLSYALPFVLWGGALLAASTQYRLAAEAAAALPALLRAPWLHIALFLVAISPLFVLAIDWGRWFALWFLGSALYLVFGRALGFLNVADVTFARFAAYRVPVLGLLLLVGPFVAFPVSWASPASPLLDFVAAIGRLAG